MRGEVVHDENLALDGTDQVDPGGDFLAPDHTRTHFREAWYPTLFNRKNFDGWAADGKLNLCDRAKAQINHLLSKYQSEPLPADMAAAVQAVIDQVVREG